MDFSYTLLQIFPFFKGFFPLEDERINLIVPADPFIERIESLKKFLSDADAPRDPALSTGTDKLRVGELLPTTTNAMLGFGQEKKAFTVATLEVSQASKSVNMHRDLKLSYIRWCDKLGISTTTVANIEMVPQTLGLTTLVVMEMMKALSAVSVDNR